MAFSHGLAHARGETVHTWASFSMWREMTPDSALHSPDTYGDQPTEAGFAVGEWRLIDTVRRHTGPIA